MLKPWSRFLVSAGLVLALGAARVSAANAGNPAQDGDGLMSVSPTHVGYGSTGNTLVFTFTANNDFQSGSSVEIVVPAGWTAPTTGAGAGHVSASTGTCVLPGGALAVVGATIIIDINRCLTNEFFTVTYAGVKPGPISASPYTFLTYTDIGSGGAGITLINAPSPSVTIDPKALTVSAAGLTPANKTYNRTTTASLTVGSPSLVGVMAPDVVTLDTSGWTATFVDWNAGNGKVVYIDGLALGGADAANYTLTQPTRIANITPRPVTITAVTDSKQYDGNVNSIQPPIISAGTPLAAGDTAPGLSQDFGSRHAGINKTLVPAGLIEDGNGGNNYAYTYATISTGEITKRPITVTAVTDSKVYDGTNTSAELPVLSPATPLAPDDTEPVWTQTFDTAVVGTGKQLTPAGAVVDGNAGNNYAYTFVPDPSGAISARPVTISADAKRKIIGTVDPALTYHVTSGSLAPGDGLTLVRLPGEALGPYPITIGTFPAVLNYDLTYNGANLMIIPAPVFRSQGAYDGWVLESTPVSSAGGSMNSAGTTFQLGDDAANRQYRAILSFDTSNLPNNAIVTRAVLKIKQYGAPSGLNPFSYLGGLLVDVRKGTFGLPGLAISDFQAAPSAGRVATFNKVPSQGWYAATLNLAGRNNVNRTGMTQFRLYFTKGDNANLKADWMKFFSGNSAVGQPQLIITYTLP